MWNGGRIQRGTPDAFGMAAGPKLYINQPYLDVISITYGTPIKHIGSYAAQVLVKTKFKIMTDPLPVHALNIVVLFP